MALLYVKVPISPGSVTVSQQAPLTFFTADILTCHLRKINSETNVVSVQENNDGQQRCTIPHQQTVLLVVMMRQKHQDLGIFCFFNMSSIHTNGGKNIKNTHQSLCFALISLVIHIFKGLFLSYFFSYTFTFTKPFSSILICILKVFPVGFVHVLFIYRICIPKNMAKILFFFFDL